MLPFVFFIRLNYPAAPMTLTIFTVTIGLVMGYSWQDATFPTLSTAGKIFESCCRILLGANSVLRALLGVGIEVAWVCGPIIVYALT